MRRIALLSLCLSLMPLPAAADIMVGVAGPMGGQNAVFGEQMKTGVQAALDAINASGGINGERLAMTVGDDACDTRRALDVAGDFVRQDVRVVIGHFCSGAVIATAKTYEQAGILVISPSATGPAVTEGGNWNVFRVASRDDAQAEFAAARIATDDGNAKLAIIDDGQSTGRALAQRMKQLVEGAIDITIKAGSADHAALIEKLKEAGITAIYFTTAATDAGGIAAAVKQAGLSIRFYGADALLNNVYWERAKDAGEGTQVTFATDPVSLVVPVTLQDIFTSKGLASDGAVVPSFAAVQAFAAAAKARDVNDGRAMANWLKGGATIQTVMGPIGFTAKGDIKPQHFTWYRWSVGEFAESPNQN
ncbi:MAG: branched-chain amino acid ABC transporter substrate-binding protein [Proteobacteria bacterium]|nr:branched-chain amino acid ABC transporter substrate-binding protein [Pseudomonadota bacterium]